MLFSAVFFSRFFVFKLVREWEREGERGLFFTYKTNARAYNFSHRLSSRPSFVVHQTQAQNTLFLSLSFRSFFFFAVFHWMENYNGKNYRKRGTWDSRKTFSLSVLCLRFVSLHLPATNTFTFREDASDAFFFSHFLSCLSIIRMPFNGAISSAEKKKKKKYCNRHNNR